MTIDPSVAAVIIGASFTASLGLMAWIVKTLAEVNVKVESMDERVKRLEEHEDRR